jgi:hypothetical protein
VRWSRAAHAAHGWSAVQAFDGPVPNFSGVLEKRLEMA